MKTTLSSSRAVQLAVAAGLALLSAVSSAQPIYRIVGPDGRISFSDKPPAASDKATTLSPGGRTPAGSTLGELPFELREAINRYPVTLYTSEKCEPCNGARNLLTTRGIPFTERTVSSNQDIEAMQRQFNDASVPLATLGGQRLRGFSPSEWTEFLDAAGYPKASRLPPSYRNPPASPLVPPASPVAAPAPRPAAAPAAPSAPPPGPTPDNPTGIVF